MATSPQAPDNRNRAVVAFLDGRRLKGYIFNFSALKDRFRIFPETDTHRTSGTEVEMKDLKAIFFAKDFTGNSAHQESHEIAPNVQGRKTEVIFRDGEKLVGTTDAYNPQKIGFFVFPSDPRSNNLRVFVIVKNIREMSWL
jgi:uncharacterized protein DUF6982